MHELKLNLKPLLKKLEVSTKKKISSELSGSYTSAFMGRGLDFDGYREYSETDDASGIDWKASLRSQQLLVKKFSEERNLNVVFVFDVSSSMSYASVDKLKNEYAAELIASLSFAIIQSGDSAGMVMFNDNIVKNIIAATGAHQFFSIISTLSNPEYYEGKKNYLKIASFLMSSLRRGTIVIFVSDFIGINESSEKAFEFLASKFDLIGIMVRDPNDDVMPMETGQIVFSDPFSEEEILITPAEIKAKYEHEVLERKETLKKIFSKSKSSFIELTTDEPFIDKVLTFLKRRKKK